MSLFFHNSNLIDRFSSQHYAPLRDTPSLSHFLEAIHNLSAEVFRTVHTLRARAEADSKLTRKQNKKNDMEEDESQSQDSRKANYLDMECEASGSDSEGESDNAPNKYDSEDSMINDAESSPSEAATPTAHGTEIF